MWLQHIRCGFIHAWLAQSEKAPTFAFKGRGDDGYSVSNVCFKCLARENVKQCAMKGKRRIEPTFHHRRIHPNPWRHLSEPYRWPFIDFRIYAVITVGIHLRWPQLFKVFYGRIEEDSSVFLNTVNFSLQGASYYYFHPSFSEYYFLHKKIVKVIILRKPLGIALVSCDMSLLEVRCAIQIVFNVTRLF